MNWNLECLAPLVALIALQAERGWLLPLSVAGGVIAFVALASFSWWGSETGSPS
jgi:hypothetical protein